ncbi:hypothetical protein HDU97_008434 [Phlyctochytrium planicorne]|nr:hypothetical protein HDU97_008434 [Phlyctochytrium planicorne]
MKAARMDNGTIDVESSAFLLSETSFKRTLSALTSISQDSTIFSESSHPEAEQPQKLIDIEKSFEFPQTFILPEPPAPFQQLDLVEPSNSDLLINFESCNDEEVDRLVDDFVEDLRRKRRESINFFKTIVKAEYPNELESILDEEAPDFILDDDDPFVPSEAIPTPVPIVNISREEAIYFVARIQIIQNISHIEADQSHFTNFLSENISFSQSGCFLQTSRQRQRRFKFKTCQSAEETVHAQFAISQISFSINHIRSVHTFFVIVPFKNFRAFVNNF